MKEYRNRRERIRCEIGTDEQRAQLIKQSACPFTEVTPRPPTPSPSPSPVDKTAVLTRASWDVSLSYDNLSRIVHSNGCITYVNPVSMRADMCTVHRDSQLSLGNWLIAVHDGAKCRRASLQLEADLRLGCRWQLPWLCFGYCATLYQQLWLYRERSNCYESNDIAARCYESADIATRCYESTYTVTCCYESPDIATRCYESADSLPAVMNQLI